MLQVFKVIKNSQQGASKWMALKKSCNRACDIACCAAVNALLGSSRNVPSPLTSRDRETFPGHPGNDLLGGYIAMCRVAFTSSSKGPLFRIHVRALVHLGLCIVLIACQLTCRRTGDSTKP